MTPTRNGPSNKPTENFSGSASANTSLATATVTDSVSSASAHVSSVCVDLSGAFPWVCVWLLRPTSTVSDDLLQPHGQTVSDGSVAMGDGHSQFHRGAGVSMSYAVFIGYRIPRV